MNSRPKQIFRHSDRLAARPGEALPFHVSCEDVASYATDFKGPYRGAWFVCQPGSYVEVSDESGVLAAPDDVLIEAYIFPTLPLGTRSGQFGAYHVTQNSFGESSRMQTLPGNWSDTTKSGYALVLDQGKPTLGWNDGITTYKLSLNAAIEAHRLKMNSQGETNVE